MVQDLIDVGADLLDPSLDRPWPWWRDRIWGLLGRETRLRTILSEKHRKTEKPAPRPVR